MARLENNNNVKLSFKRTYETAFHFDARIRKE